MWETSFPDRRPLCLSVARTKAMALRVWLVPLGSSCAFSSGIYPQEQEKQKWPATQPMAR